MTKYKGRLSTKAVETAFPNIVELEIPEGGLKFKADAIEAWRVARGIDLKNGRGGHRDGVWFVRYCFLHREGAEDFVSQFGGQLLPEVRRGAGSRGSA